MFRFLILLVIPLSWSLLSPSFLFAQDSGNNKALIVGTKIAPPFAMKADDGSWEGISIELWDEIAKKLDLDYEWQEHNLQSLLDGVTDTRLDAGIAAITITSEREKHFDFSHSYYSTGLSIAVPKNATNGWLNVLQGIFSSRMLIIVLMLAGVLFLVGTLAWLLERKKNPEHFSPQPLTGIADGIWWAAVTMTTVGYGDMAPKSLGGRIVAILWMFSSLLLLSAIIAGIATTLTLSKIQPLVSGPRDLARARVASIESSTSDHYLKDHHIKGRYYPSVLAGLEAVNQNKVNAMVYDAPLLVHLIKGHFEGDLEVLEGRFELQDYGIAFPENSPLREPVNRIMLNIIHEPEWQETLKKYLGD